MHLLSGRHVQHFFMVYFKHVLFKEFMLALDSNLGKAVHCSWLTANTQMSCFLCFSEAILLGWMQCWFYVWWTLCWSNGLARYHIVKQQGTFPWGPKTRFDWLDKLDIHDLPVMDVVLSISLSAIMMGIHTTVDAILPCFDSKVYLVWLAV